MAGQWTLGSKPCFQTLWAFYEVLQLAVKFNTTNELSLRRLLTIMSLFYIRYSVREFDNIVHLWQYKFQNEFCIFAFREVVRKTNSWIISLGFNTYLCGTMNKLPLWASVCLSTRWRPCSISLISFGDMSKYI